MLISNTYFKPCIATKFSYLTKIIYFEYLNSEKESQVFIFLKLLLGNVATAS